MEYLNFLLIHFISLMICGFIQVYIFTKITFYVVFHVLKVVLKYGMNKCVQCVLTMCYGGNFCQNCYGKLDLTAKRHNKSFFLSIWTILGSIINKQINLDSILMFIYGLTIESIRNLMRTIAQQTPDKSNIHQQQSSINRFSTSNDPVILARAIASMVTIIRANTYMLIEFGSELVHLTLKCGKPLMICVNDSIGSCSTVAVTTLTLKCISMMIIKQMSLQRLDAAISIFGNFFILPMHSVLKTLVNILWINYKKN